MTTWWTDPRFAEGAARYDGGEYFEAHEAWEHLWRAMPPGDDKRFVQGLIQLAVSLEHARRQNPRGSAGQWAKAVDKLFPTRPPVDAEATVALARAHLDGQPGAPRVVYVDDLPAAYEPP